MRNELIDCLKGFLIILVVIGHVVFDLELNAYENAVFKFCYSFHMFLFIGISGYLIAHNESNLMWLKKRFCRLIIPFVIWSSIIMFYLDLKLEAYFFMFSNPVLWYLVVLFCCDFLLYVTNFFYKRKKKGACIFLNIIPMIRI